MLGSRSIRAGLASAHVLLARHVAFPLHERAKRHVTARMLRDMEAEQWLPVGELQERQAARLRALVAHAADTVPYYRRLFRESALQPRHIEACADVSKIPFLSKDDIRKSLEEMRSATASRVVRRTTGGSTGEPLAFYLGPTRVSSDVAARCRAERWWGLGVGELEFVLWSSPIEIGTQDVLRAARDRLLRTRLFSAFEMSPQALDRYIAHLLRTPYRRVFGYPGALALLCERAAATGRQLQRVGVRGVFVTGEYLRDEWRALISGSFGCPVANGYGGRESGFIAHECPAGRLHITADRLIVEIVDDAGNVLDPGESGEIVVTHLDTPEMPLLRYRTGDLGALAADACPCGRTLPVLARVEGRKMDFVVAPDGRVLHGVSVMYILRDIEGVRQYRVTQKRVDRFEIEIVPAENYSRRSEAQISDELSRRLRTAVAVTFMYRDAIPSGPSGKFRHVICDIGGASSAMEATADP
jgi:phenylacetate-coenzyme A ligase PaaK-like adenylate-forming protein